MSHETANVPIDGLKIANACKSYGALRALDGVSIEVPRGTVVGFLGPNGAGKTTTMRAVVGMVALDEGSVTWGGVTIDDKRRLGIGYMPQERGVYARMKVREQIIYFARLSGLSKADAGDRADYWIDRVGLVDRANSLVQELSGGNQQRVQLAVSLVHDPDLLILDEPFSGLDPLAADTMREIIAERATAGASVLMSSHQLDLVEDLCESVVIIAKGAVVGAGAIADLRSSAPTRRLSVRWFDVVEEFTPRVGTLRHFDGHSAVVEMSSTDDVGASVEHALAAGVVAEVRVEPPTLDEIFVSLVGRGK